MVANGSGSFFKMSDKIKCKDLLGCKQVDCPAYDADTPHCWLIDGTRCHDDGQDPFLSKAELCLDCPVFKRNMDPERMEASCKALAHQFGEARRILAQRDRELESISMEMAIGLSEVFEALKKIAAGDPQVRLDEASPLELIAKLKHMVNQTAANMGEMVDMSHEFAMGLAEHFDVLLRVSRGDLRARVGGHSSIELLESLKTVTNQTIDSVKQEIERRRQTARDLKVSEERFRTFAENAPIGISIMAPDLTFTFINPTFTEIFGYTIDDIPDKATWFNKAYPDPAYREEVIARWNTHKGKTGRLIPATLQMHCKNGLKKTVVVQTVIMEDGKHLMTYSDVTRQAMAQEVLRESEEKYRTLINNIQDGVALTEKGRFLFVNEAMARMVGYSVEEMVGMEQLDIVAPEDRELVAERYRRRQAGEAVTRNYELRLLHKDGTTRLYVNLMADIINYQNRGVTIATIKDMTASRQAGIERRKMAEKLERSKKMEAIGTLAGGVAHDLNNILSGIVSYPELLLMDLPDDSPIKGPILTIQKSGERAAAIVQDLLTLARRGVATMEVIDLNQIVTDYLSSPEFAKLCSFHPRATIHHSLADHLQTINGSPVHLLKTIMNLVSNAVEAMPDGGTIFISTENRYVDPSIDGFWDVPEGSYVILKVVDTGVGISPKDMEQIFEPFYTKKVMGRSGTGLGMAVVWGTVKDHKGHIDVRSLEGQGTTFTLFFPASQDQCPLRDDSMAIESIMGDGQTILVVDDVPEQREIASAMLDRLGYGAVTVDSGEAAVAYLQDHDVDLVLLDMIMAPGIDGLETYRRISAFKPGQKAVIASGYSETERVKALQRMGVNAYLKKPYSIEKIGTIVKQSLLAG
jgi:PAS domain S-box-containing protein